MPQTLFESMQQFDQLLPESQRSRVEPGVAWSTRCEQLSVRIRLDDPRLTQTPIRDRLAYCPVSVVLAISSIQPDPVGFALSLGNRVVERLLRVDRAVLAREVFSRANTRTTLAALLDHQPGAFAP